MENLSGRTIRGYEIGERVGAGGFGVVYRAHQRSVNREVAVKAILPEFAEHPDFLERFEREAQLIARLEHPFIVPLHDYWHDEQGSFLVMRWLQGGNLRERLDQGPLEPMGAARLLEQITQALDFAHKRNVIHRDLKPENILLDDTENAYLSDFGIAKDLASEKLTQTGKIMGSVDYLAPEQARGDPITARADVYALGVLLYELLTRQHPFSGSTAVQMLQKHLNQELPSARQRQPSLPEALDAVIQRATHKDPKDRYGQASELSRAISLALDVGELEAGPQAVTARPSHNLPAPPTPFVGRESELLELDRLLQDPDIRLLSLIGPGGVGKSRLALELAARHQEAYPAGVWFVELASLDTHALLAPTIAASLGIELYSPEDPTSQLLDYLREKKLLLALDNFEHLIEAAALLKEIVATAPSVQLLITSRERLHLQAEVVWEVSGMRYPINGKPGEEHSAYRLFLDRAERARAGFAPSEKDQRAISRICQSVDGLPLGIELAAPWVRALSCAEIAVEIESNLDFLGSEARDVPERHRSLRAVFEYSWANQTQEQRQVLKRSAVFRGGFDRRAASEVAGASLGSLTELLDHSLLQHQAMGRYSLHPLVRAYAAEKVQSGSDEERLIRDRHARHYAIFLYERTEALQGMGQQTALLEIGPEIENIRAAWRWAAQSGIHSVLEKAWRPLFLVYESKGWLSEGETAFAMAAEGLMAQAAEIEGADIERTLASLRARRGTFEFRLGSYEQADQLLKEALAVARQAENADETAFCLNQLGNIAFRHGEHARAIERYQEALARWKEAGNRRGEGIAMNNLSVLARAHGGPQARKMLLESLAIFEEVGYSRGVAAGHFNLGYQEFFQGNYDQSVELFKESLALRREVGDYLGEAESLHQLGSVHFMRGELELAERHFAEGLAIRRDIGHRRGIAESLGELGYLKLQGGQFEPAGEMFEEALRISNEMGNPVGEAQCLAFLGALARHQGKPEKARRRYTESLRIYDQMKSDWGLSYARRLLGTLAVEQGDLKEARRQLAQALPAIERAGLGPPYKLGAVVEMAELLAAEGEWARAAELATYAHEQPTLPWEAREEARDLIRRGSERLEQAELARMRAKAESVKLPELFDQLQAELAGAS